MRLAAIQNLPRSNPTESKWTIEEKAKDADITDHRLIKQAFRINKKNITLAFSKYGICVVLRILSCR